MTDANANTKSQNETDQKLRQWLLSDELREYMVSAREAKQSLDKVGPHITISRQAAAGGRDVALLLAQELNWDVLDKEVLDIMAERYQDARGSLEFVDETQANWIHDIFGNWFDSRVVSHQKYLVHLERIIWLAAVHGRVIFVGRGAQFILPKGQGLAVRVTAALEDRIDRMARRGMAPQDDASSYVDDIDRQRSEFVRQFFHQDIDDAGLYDLTLDTSELGIEGTAQRILEAYRESHSASENRT
jgi:cytidylate kinase